MESKSQTQTQNETTNQNEVSEEEKELEIELQNHYSKMFEKDNEIILVDLLTKNRNKEKIEIMASTVSKLLLGEANVNVKENIEPVDIIGEFPSKKIFLITERDHFVKHYYFMIERYWLTKEKEIEKFISNRPLPRDDYVIFVDREKPYALGVHAHYFTISAELMNEIVKEIGRGLMEATGHSVDKIRIEEEKRSYIYLIPHYFIYDNKIIKRHIIKNDVWYSEEEKYEYTIDWFSIYEIDEDFLEYLKDP